MNNPGSKTTDQYNVNQNQPNDRILSGKSG